MATGSGTMTPASGLTYLGTLATNRDKVRFYLRDTTASAGPRPGGENFTDAEIDGLISNEGSWGRAVAAGFEVLAAEWSVEYSFTADGLTAQRGQVAQRYEMLAAKWRRDYGAAGTAGVAQVTRVDGYSDDIAADET